MYKEKRSKYLSVRKGIWFVSWFISGTSGAGYDGENLAIMQLRWNGSMSILSQISRKESEDWPSMPTQLMDT